MCEFTMAQIYSHMPDFIGRMKKDKISGAKQFRSHYGTEPALHFGGARQLDMEKVAVDFLNKS